MSRIRPGLCSVTLRAASVEAVARVAGDCGLNAIEWGGDVHVPSGDLAAAARARAATLAADAVVASYGSYAFATGIPTAAEQDVLLDTAVALGAPNVRVWATFGVQPDTAAYSGLADGLRSFCVGAGVRGLTVGLEFHGGTVTATAAGAVTLVNRVDRPELFTYWQPPYWRGPTSPESDVADVRVLGPRVSHLHVYEWVDAEDRRPLAEGGDRWRAVLNTVENLRSTWAGDRIAFCEFVAGDDPEVLRRDAAVLRAWLGETRA